MSTFRYILTALCFLLMCPSVMAQGEFPDNREFEPRSKVGQEIKYYNHPKEKNNILRHNRKRLAQGLPEFIPRATYNEATYRSLSDQISKKRLAEERARDLERRAAANERASKFNANPPSKVTFPPTGSLASGRSQTGSKASGGTSVEKTKITKISWVGAALLGWGAWETLFSKDDATPAERAAESSQEGAPFAPFDPVESSTASGFAQ